MKRSRTTFGNLGTLVGSIPPKAVLAAVLLLVMALLWLRVFLRGRGGPELVEAQALPEQVSSPTSRRATSPSIVMERVALPVVAGWHDQLERDPFVFDRSKWPGLEEPAAVSVQSRPSESSEKQQRNALLQKVVGELILQAIIKDPSGVPIQACLNGTVLAVGGRLKIRSHGEIYEFTLTEIGSDEVRLEYQNVLFTVKMPSSEWVD